MFPLSIIVIWVSILYIITDANEDRSNRHCDDTDISPADILSAPAARDYICFTRAKWKDLKPFMHPTQPDVGYALVIRKVMHDFNSVSRAQTFMDPVWSKRWPNLNENDFNYTYNTIPVIVGPTAKNNSLRFYAVDYHHHLCALDYSGFNKTYVYLNILDDYRSYSYHDFIEQLKEEKNTYLYSQYGSKKSVPANISFHHLPKTWDFNRNKNVFGDNPWRSLVGYGRKLNHAPAPFPSCNVTNGDSEYCMRQFIKSCNKNGHDIPFFEFIWAYFFVDATYVNTQYWNGSDSLHTFRKKYDELIGTYYDTNGDWIDLSLEKYDKSSVIEDWDQAASLLVPLSRSSLTAAYKPLDFFDMDQLPGYIEGPQKVDDDPICSPLPPDDKGLSLYEMIAIIGGIVLGVFCIGSLIAYAVCRVRKRRKMDQQLPSVSDYKPLNT